VQVGLRIVLAACLGGVGLAFTVGTAALLQAEAGRRIQHMIGGQLHQYASQVADKLDRGMFERYRDLLVVSSLEAVRSPEASPTTRRVVLQRLQDTYRDYAWIGFIRPNGILEAATGGVLEGADVNTRGWWKSGLEHPYVGDVHDAVVLGKILYADRAEPPRFVDLATPVRDDNGTVLGVVAAHLSWDWASEVEQSVLGPAAEDQRAEAMILATDDTVILGPKALVGHRFDTSSLGSPDAVIRVWPDGAEYLTSVATTRGYRDYPGLGWRVVLRQPMALAMAPVRDLRDSVIAWGAAGSLLAVLVGYLMAGWISAPLRAMARSVDAAGSNGTAPVLPTACRYAEIRTLTGAVGTYLDELRQADMKLRASLDEKTILLHEIHHRVKNNLQVIYGLMMMEARQFPKGEPGRERMEAVARRVTSMGRLHEQLYKSGDLAQIDFAQHLRQLCDALLELRPHDAVAIRLETDTTICSLEMATPLGLIANELVINAVKHAFPARRPGTVTISLHDEDGNIVMQVADDGVGCAGKLPSGGVGTTLVSALVRQLGGTLSFEVEKGCVARLVVPKIIPMTTSNPQHAVAA
jgi:two-component sensor histidine kinase/uncharacterized protein YbjQ (UPF0145 family)